MHKEIKGGRSLRVRIAVLAVLCWLVPTAVLGAYINGVLSGTLREKTEQALISGASHAQALAVEEIENLLAKSKNVTYDEQFYGIVDAYRAGSQPYESFFVSARAAWQKLFQRERLYTFTAFFLLDEPENIIYTGDSVDSLLTFQGEVQPEMLAISEALDTRSRFLYIEGTLYHVRNLVDRRLERFGMIALGLSPERLLSPMLTRDALWYGNVDLLLDDYHSIVNDLPLSKDDFRTGLYEEDGSIYYGQQIKTSDYMFSYRMRIDKASVYGDMDGYFLLTLLLVLLLPVVAALAAWYAHRRIAKPLIGLADAIARSVDGETCLPVAARGSGEIAALGEAYRAMCAGLAAQRDRAQKEETAVRDMQIAALQSHLTLRFAADAVQTLENRAREQGDASGVEMAERLDALLKAALDQGEHLTVPLSEELRVAEEVLYCIRQRFGQRVSIAQEVDLNLRFIHVPRLCVVLLLQNAVELSIAPADGGTLRLRVYARDGSLCIDLASRGKRWDEADRRNIERLLARGEQAERGSFSSVRNVDARLKQAYGEGAGLTVDIGEAEMLACIVIPFGEADTGDV